MRRTRLLFFVQKKVPRRRSLCDIRCNEPQIEQDSGALLFTRNVCAAVSG
jgi:hypothetical protein